MRDKVHGTGDPRARRAAAQHRRDAVARASATSQAGTVRPGLTLEDGTLVVTDNYLKVRIPPGLSAERSA